MQQLENLYICTVDSDSGLARDARRRTITRFNGHTHIRRMHVCVYMNFGI